MNKNNIELFSKMNQFDLYDIMQMIIDDYYTRQKYLIDKRIAEDISKYVDVKDIATGDRNIFFKNGLI